MLLLNEARGSSFSDSYLLMCLSFYTSSICKSACHCIHLHQCLSCTNSYLCLPCLLDGHLLVHLSICQLMQILIST